VLHNFLQPQIFTAHKPTIPFGGGEITSAALLKLNTELSFKEVKYP